MSNVPTTIPCDGHPTELRRRQCQDRLLRRIEHHPDIRRQRLIAIPPDDTKIVSSGGSNTMQIFGDNVSSPVPGSSPPADRIPCRYPETTSRHHTTTSTRASPPRRYRHTRGHWHAILVKSITVYRRNRRIVYYT